MCKDVLITGVTVTQQRNRAKEILKSQVIPKENKFQQRKKKGLLSQELIIAIKENA